MKRAEKESFVAGLRERIDRAPVVYFTDFSGLDVKSLTELRSALRDNGAEFVVVKNRLAKRAFGETDLPDISKSLTGPTGVVFGYEGPVGAAKALSDFAKDHDSKPAFKLGLLDEKVIEPEQIDRIAKLPPREQLLAELAGAMEAPMAMLAAALGAKLQEMAGLLDALKNEREQAGG
ncbi:MAG: 50S ribosomal protein L10 [Longimicrobiales bacterium]